MAWTEPATDKNNNCPEDDNDVVDCFPWQGKQPVLPQGIPSNNPHGKITPTTANTHNKNDTNDYPYVVNAPYDYACGYVPTNTMYPYNCPQ